MPYASNSNFYNSITYELSTDRTLYTRSVYSIFDFFGNVGGLFGALTVICRILVKIFQLKGIYIQLLDDLYMAGHNYKSKSRNLYKAEYKRTNLVPARSFDIDMEKSV